MPHIRMLILTVEAPTLTTFTDGAATVTVTTDADTGVPTAVSIDADALALISEHDNVRAWAAQIAGGTRQVNTIGGFPGMQANAAG